MSTNNASLDVLSASPLGFDLAEIEALAATHVEETATEAEIESVVSEIEAEAVSAEAVLNEEVHESEVLADDEAAPAQSFGEIMAALDKADVRRMAFDVADRIDLRIDEANRKGRPTKNFEAARKKMITDDVARVLLASGVAFPSFITRELIEGEMFNVYALKEKIPDIAKALTGGKLTNAINVCVLRSLFNLERAGKALCYEFVRYAASDKVAVKHEGVRQHLIRHTVAESTATTQAGSTFHSLLALGIIQLTSPGKQPSFEFAKAPIVNALREAILVAEAEEE